MASLIEAPTSYASQVVEQAILSVSAGRPVFLKFVGTNIGSRADTPFYYNIPNMSNCARMSGDGIFPIVAVRGTKANFNIERFIDTFDSFHKTFETVAPFSSYKKKFSYFVDLNNYVDTEWLYGLEQVAIYNVLVARSISPQLNFFSKIPRSVSSCQIPGATYMWYTSMANTSLPEGISAPAVGALAVDGTRDSYVAVHEFGHAFGGLNDEYIYSAAAQNFAAGSGSMPPLDLPLTNCAWNYPAQKYSFGGKLYGGKTYLGCSWTPITTTNMFTGKTVTNRFFRPSNKSIMNNQDDSHYFNVVSCGYLLKKIVAGTNPVGWYYPECFAMNTVKI